MFNQKKTQKVNFILFQITNPVFTLIKVRMAHSSIARMKIYPISFRSKFFLQTNSRANPIKYEAKKRSN